MSVNLDLRSGVVFALQAVVVVMAGVATKVIVKKALDLYRAAYASKDNKMSWLYRAAYASKDNKMSWKTVEYISDKLAQMVTISGLFCLAYGYYGKHAPEMGKTL
jgi:hypothetical protein